MRANIPHNPHPSHLARSGPDISWTTSDWTPQAIQQYAGPSSSIAPFISSLTAHYYAGISGTGASTATFLAENKVCAIVDMECTMTS